MAEASSYPDVRLIFTAGEKAKADYERKLKSAETKKTKIQNELSAATSDHHRRQLQDELFRIMSEADNCNSEIQEIEVRIHRYERRIAEIRGGAEERQRKEESAKRLFNEAMKDGYVTLSINNVLLFGVAGSGKTCLKLMLTNQQPPQQRESTPLMEKPVKVNIRPVSSSKFKSTGRTWVEVSQKKLLNLLARTVSKYSKRELDQSIGSRVTESLKQMTTDSKPALVSSTTQVDSVSSDRQVHRSEPLISGAISETIDSVVRMVARELKSATKKSDSSEDQKGGELFDSTWVYISDCGGQPQFHDILSIFVRHISMALVVLRLTDDLSSFPLDEYYKDGQLVGLPHASHMTLEETLKSLIRSVESHSSQEKKTNLMFIGTFLDRVEGSATLEEKNRAILDMLSPAIKRQVVFVDRSMKHPIFAVNTLSREDAALQTADDIRKAIESYLPNKVKVPVWWFFLDFNLQFLAILLDRGVLRKQECLMLAVRFGFDHNHLEAALNFFNEMCIAHYYPSILPDTVFVNSQIPLDKITELTEHAIALRNAECISEGSTVTKGEWMRFRDEGVLTLEMLQQKQFDKHYIEGIFSATDMLLIMKELLVIAPIPLVGESDSSLLKAEFFMPSLLKSCSPAELDKYRFFPDTISPVLLCFPSGCIRSGVFCCLVVHLIKRVGWEVMLPSGQPILIAKNCVQFRIPKHTCTVTLIDSFSYIEVYVNAPPTIGSKLCPQIRYNLLNGIKAACDVLHYNNDSPQISIFCPCQKSDSKLHIAEINDDGYWTCSLQAGIWNELSPQHRVWLNKSCESSCESKLSIGELKRSTGVTDQQLNEEIEAKDFYMLGRNFDTLTGLLGELDLNPADCGNVRRRVDQEDIQSGVALALRLWQRMNPTNSTFKELVEISLRLRKGDIALQICKYIVKKYK